MSEVVVPSQPLLQRVHDHFVDYVVPAGVEYRQSEIALSEAHETHGDGSEEYRQAQRKAIRFASNLAIAFDGLVDRMMAAEGTNRKQVYAVIEPLCQIGGHVREGVLERIFSIANAYKHDELKDARNVLLSSDDVLAVGAGYGVDGYGVGKFSGPEVLVDTKTGQRRKFLGDAYMARIGWRTYLESKGFNFSAVQGL